MNKLLLVGLLLVGTVYTNACNIDVKTQCERADKLVQISDEMYVLEGRTKDSIYELNRVIGMVKHIYQYHGNEIDKVYMLNLVQHYQAVIELRKLKENI